jgi:hypothetical protein
MQILAVAADDQCIAAKRLQTVNGVWQGQFVDISPCA